MRGAFTSRASAGEIIALIIPHPDIDQLPADLCGQVLLRERDVTRRLVARFESLEAWLSEVGADEAQARQSSVHSVLIAAFDDALNEADLPPRRRSSGAVPGPACQAVGDAPTSLQVSETILLGWSKRDDRPVAGASPAG